MEKYISQDTVSLRELPLSDKKLFPLFEEYLHELHSPYFNRYRMPSFEEILSYLSPNQRTLIELHFLEGLSLVDIARRLKISKKTASVRLSRAKKKLKEILTSSNKKI